MTNTSAIGRVQAGYSLEPYRGFKVLGIRNPKKGEEKLVMYGPHYGSAKRMYTNMSEAYCRHSQKKKNDDLAHRCGFYAYNSLRQAIVHWAVMCDEASSIYVAEVAFSGKTVIGEHGAKGQIQRIVKLFVPPCIFCDSAKAESFAQDRKGRPCPCLFILLK